MLLEETIKASKIPSKYSNHKMLKGKSSSFSQQHEPQSRKLAYYPITSPTPSNIYFILLLIYLVYYHPFTLLNRSQLEYPIVLNLI